MKEKQKELFEAAYITARFMACGDPLLDEKGNFVKWLLKPNDKMRKWLIKEYGSKAGIMAERPNDIQEAVAEALQQKELYERLPKPEPKYNPVEIIPIDIEL